MENGTQLDYANLINLVVELRARGGYLDTQEQNQRNELAGRYETAKRGFVHALLKDGRSAEDAKAAVVHDLDEITAHSDESWQDIYEEVRYDLLAQIERDADRKPWARTLRHRAGWIVLAVVVAVYFSVRFYNAAPVDAPLLSRSGLEQRAVALHKVLRYDDWMSTRVRRGGLFKGILLWPIEPTDAEVKGAGELAGLTFAGATELMRAGEICGFDATSGEQLSEQQEALLWTVGDHLRASTTSWREPLVNTVLDPIRRAHPCDRAADAGSAR